MARSDDPSSLVRRARPQPYRSRVLISDRYERRRLELVAAHSQGRTLDVGHAQQPNPFLDRAQTVGIDLEAPAVPSGYSEDIVGSAANLSLSFDPSSFDSVVAAEFIEHLEDPYGFLRSVSTVLRDDGRLVLSTPNPIAFPTLGFEILRSRRYFYTEDHTFYFTPRWVERMLDRAGFDLEATMPVGLWLPRGYLRWSPVWLSYQVVYVARRRRGQ